MRKQRRRSNSTIHLLPKSEISSLKSSFVAVQIGFVLELVNPEDRFSHDPYQIVSMLSFLAVTAL